MAFEGIGQGGFARGAAVTRELGQRDRRLDIAEGQEITARQGAATKQFKDLLTQALDISTGILENADLQGTPRTDPGVQKGVNAAFGTVMPVAQEMEAQGILPRGTAGLIEQRMQTVLNSPTLQQRNEAKAEQAGAVAGAETSGRQEAKVESLDQLQLEPEQRQRALASVLGVNLDGPQGAEFMQLLQGMEGATATERALIQKRLNKLTARNAPLIQIGGLPSVDEQGNLVLSGAGGAATGTTGTGAATAGVPKGVAKFLTGGSTLDEARGRLSMTTRSVEMLDVILEQIKAQPERFGITGEVTAKVENVAGMMTDLAGAGLRSIGATDLVEAASDLRELFSTDVESQEVVDELIPASAGSVDIFEGILAFGIARTLQPEGKLLLDAVRTGKEMAKLRGVIATGRVAERVETTRNLLQRQADDTVSRMQQGVGGQGKERRPIITPGSITPEVIDDLSDEESVDLFNVLIPGQ